MFMEDFVMLCYELQVLTLLLVWHTRPSFGSAHGWHCWRCSKWELPHGSRWEALWSTMLTMSSLMEGALILSYVPRYV